MTALLTAISKDDAKEVERLIQAGANVEQADADRRTPLMYAVLDGNDALVDLLIRHGANVDAQGADGNTSLHLAAQAYRVAVAGLLLQAGAKTELVDVHGNTPLWRAVFNSNGRGEVIQLLLAHGANRDARNNAGRSPADLADTIANHDIKQFLK